MASATSAAAQGYNLVADQENSTVVGQWNLEDQAGVLFAVGNGADADSRSDAFQVDASGNVMASGTIMAGGQNLLTLIASLQTQVDSLNAQLSALHTQLDSLGGN